MGRHHRGGIIGQASWRKYHGGGTTEEASIIEDASWRRHHRGAITEETFVVEESWGSHH